MLGVYTCYEDGDVYEGAWVYGKRSEGAKLSAETDRLIKKAQAAKAQGMKNINNSVVIASRRLTEASKSMSESVSSVNKSVATKMSVMMREH
jgi:hypothetical protein